MSQFLPWRQDSPAKMALSGIVLLCIVGIAGAFLVTQVAGASDRQQARDLPNCEGEATADCLELRAGEFSGSYSKDRKTKSFRFEPEDGESDRVKLRLSRAEVRDLRSDGTQGIYHDGELIGVEASDGDREFRTGGGTLPPLWFFAVAGVLLLIGVGCGALLLRMSQQDSPAARFGGADPAERDAMMREFKERFGDQEPPSSSPPPPPPPSGPPAQ